ncbi:SWIM zinc finger protein [Phyllosticta capitalensis]
MGVEDPSNPTPDASGAAVPPPLAPRPRRKRKQPASYAEEDDAPTAATPGKRARKTKAPAKKEVVVLDDDTQKEAKPKSKGKGKAKAEAPEEKRLRRCRAQPPQAFQDIEYRALNQRMFVLDRSRAGTEDCPEENVDIAGSTGNVYTVNISKVPRCTCPYNQKGNQCKHIAYVLNRTLKAPRHLQYQLAFVSSELREIFAKAPAIPSEAASTEDKDGRRKPLEDDCPICCCEFEPTKEEIVYCKAACGNNIHKECFNQWAATKHGEVTCPFCRSPWQQDLDESLARKHAKSGKVNAEGYVNVADQLGISRERDYSTYHDFWVRGQARAGLIPGHWRDFGREYD